MLTCCRPAIAGSALRNRRQTSQGVYPRRTVQQGGDRPVDRRRQSLATVVQQDGKFPYLIDDQSNWIDRKDVWYRGVVTATADQWRSVGCGAGDNSIGPELGFGHIVGDYHEEPVPCLKASQGNRSLGWDYLPPGSERFEHDGFDYAGYRNSPARWEKGTKAEN